MEVERSALDSLRHPMVHPYMSNVGVRGNCTTFRDFPSDDPFWEGMAWTLGGTLSEGAFSIRFGLFCMFHDSDSAIWVS